MVIPRPASRSRSGLVRLVGGFLLLVTVSAAFADDPPKPPARLVPAEGLSAYLEYDGLDAHDAAWKATTAHALLRDTPAGATVADVVRQVVDRAVKEVPGAELTGADVVALHDHVLGNGFVLANYDEGNDLDSTVIVLRGLGRKDARARYERAIRTMLGKEGAAALKPTTIRGRAIYQMKDTPKVAAVPINVPGSAVRMPMPGLGPNVPPPDAPAGVPADRQPVYLGGVPAVAPPDAPAGVPAVAPGAPSPRACPPSRRRPSPWACPPSRRHPHPEMLPSPWACPPARRPRSRRAGMVPWCRPPLPSRSPRRCRQARSSRRRSPRARRRSSRGGSKGMT